MEIREVRFKARLKRTGSPDPVILYELPAEDATSLEQFLTYKQDREQKEGFEKFLEVNVRFWYERRSVKANNLHMELCDRLAKKTYQSKESIHEACKQATYPKEEVCGQWVPKQGKDLSTVEFAKSIEWLINECAEQAVDIRDIWILFTDWRFGQKFDPLEGQYSSEADYRDKHPLCELCGSFLLYRGPTGEYRSRGELAHIVSKGAGGPDDDWNRLMSCPACHRSSPDAIHQKGWEAALAKAPWMRPKVERAFARVGKIRAERGNREALEIF